MCVASQRRSSSPPPHPTYPPAPSLSVGPSPTRALSLSLDEADRSTSQQASGKMLVQQARELVRKWRLKLQALPSLNRQLKEAMARAARCVLTYLPTCPPAYARHPSPRLVHVCIPCLRTDHT